MNQIDEKCRFYIKQDGSCSSQDTDCVKCINCYCDWKVYQEQLQQLKTENEELKQELDKFKSNYAFYYAVHKLAMQQRDIAEESVNVNGNLKQKLENIEEAVSESIAVNEFATPLAKIILQILKEE